MTRKIKIKQVPHMDTEVMTIRKRYKNGEIEFKTLKLFRELAKAVSPPPVLTVSQWADR